MNKSPTKIRYNYDIFISHNRADKEWVRTLADRLAAERYNGRPLRPWLDEQFLDPGDLGSDSELTTAIDRSRFFGLVLSPEAVASKWVNFELKYFLGARDRETIVSILLKTCSTQTIPPDLKTFDFRDEAHFEERFKDLVEKICPAGEIDLGKVEHGVDGAFERLAASDPGGFNPGTTPERDEFFRELSLYDIDESVSEGLAVAAFDRAADHLIRINVQSSDVAYNFKMLLGECLAAALYRSPGYRQIAQRFLDRAEKSDDSTLLFVVARAYSKLAEIDLRFVDLSVLMRLISQFDRKHHIDNQEKAIELLISRIVGKIRNSTLGEFMIKTLSEGGRTSRIVTAFAISPNSIHNSPVFYLSELERFYNNRDQQQELTEPPSRRLLSLLFGLDLFQDSSVSSAVQLVKQELRQNFPGIDFPYGYSWLSLSKGIIVMNQHNAPFMGTIVKATLGNMVELVEKLDVSHVVCLTEPRIVDALFDNCGALLLLDQDINSHQCRRLRNRGVPFGMMSPGMMSQLSNGDHIVVDQKQATIWKGK